jgi:hypothetical protein
MDINIVDGAWDIQRNRLVHPQSTEEEIRMGKFDPLRRAWYGNNIILFQVIENLKYRETVFIAKGKPVIRCVKANAMRYLQMNFERYRFLSEPFNLYGSLAHFPNLPMFSFNRVEKRKEMDDFNVQYRDYIKKYDFMMDIDAEDGKILTALDTLKRILPLWDGIPYYVVFSGTKGFHIRVDWDDFPEEYQRMNFTDLSNLFKKFAENFAIINYFGKREDIDYTIYDLRRIAKTPYSVVHMTINDEQEPMFVALPMSDDMIQNFNLKEYHIKNLMGRIPEMRNRGLLKRPGSGDKFAKLIKEYVELK